MHEESTETKTAGRRRFKKTLSALVLLFLAVFSFLAGIAAFLRIGLNDQLLARLVISHARQSFHWKVGLTNAHLFWVSTDIARIRFRGLEIQGIDDSGAILKIPEVTLEIMPFHAFSGKIQINSAHLTEPSLFLPHYGTPVKQSQASSPTLRLPPLLFPITVDRLEIDKGLVLRRGLNAKMGDRVLLSKIQGTVVRLTPSGVERFVMETAIEGNGKIGSLHASGKISRTSYYSGKWSGDLTLNAKRCPLAGLKVLSSYFFKEFPFSDGLLNFHCRVRSDPFNTNAVGELSLHQAVPASGRFFSQTALIDPAGVKFEAIRKDETIRLDLPEIVLPGMKLSAKATLQGLSTQDPALELAVEQADFHLEKVFPLIPLNRFSAEERNRLVQAGLNGRLLITGARWTGTLAGLAESPFRKGLLAVDAYLDKVSGFIPGAGLPLKDAEGRLRLSSDEMIFNGVSLTLGASPIVLNGWITNLRTSPKTDLFLSLSAQGEDLPLVLQNPSVAVFLGPTAAGITEPQGRVSVTLAVKGDLNHPNLTGKIVLDDFQCRVPRFSLPFKGINGSLRFRGSEAIFSELKGVVGESPVEFTGTVSSEKMDVTGEMRIVPSDLKKLRVLNSDWDIAGTVPTVLTIKGNHSVTNFSIKADFKGNTIRGGRLIKKKARVPAEIEASGTFNAEGVSVEEAYLIIDRNRIFAKGKATSDGKIVLTINLPPKGIPTNILIPIIDPGYDLQPGGRLEGDAVIRIDTLRNNDVTLDTNLALSHVSLQLGFYKRVDGLTGGIRCRGKSFNFAVDRAKIGDSEFSANFSISDFQKPKVDLAVHFSFLDTTDFTAPHGHPSQTTWMDWIRTNRTVIFLARSTGTGSLKVDRGKTAVRVFSDFRAYFEGNNGIIKAPQWRLRFADGMVRGDAVFDIRPDTKRPLRLDFQADRLKVVRTNVADPERLRIDGDVTAEGRMDWLSNPKVGTQGVHKVGTIKAEIGNGIIHRFEVLSKIFSLINLGSLLRGRFPDILTEGLPFRKMTWTTEVFDTRWKFKDIKLLADAANINASGMWFSEQDRIDFKVDVSPLVGLDTLMSGLFGNRLVKDGKILTATFRVRGLPASPDVRFEPFENFRSEKD